MNPRRIQARIRADRGLLPENGSFLFRPKGRVKAEALLLHGFSACPYEVRELGRHLQGRGILAYAPRLAGHGEGQPGFDRHGFEDWRRTTEEALEELRTPGRRLLLFGHSGGGALAALLAAGHPRDFSRLVLGAPAFRLANPWAWTSELALARLFVPTLNFEMPHSDAKRHWTLRYASSRVAELRRLGREAVKAALGLELPLLMMQARGDGLVSCPFNERLFPRIPSRQKRLEVYGTGEHNVFHHHNPLQAQVFAWVDAFLK